MDQIWKIKVQTTIHTFGYQLLLSTFGPALYLCYPLHMTTRRGKSPARTPEQELEKTLHDARQFVRTRDRQRAYARERYHRIKRAAAQAATALYAAGCSQAEDEHGCDVEAIVREGWHRNMCGLSCSCKQCGQWEREHPGQDPYAP